MDDGLKQRLIGAIVLIAVAVLFLPTLFERNVERQLDLSSQIPPQPRVIPEPLDLSPPQRVADIPPAGDVDHVPEAEPPAATPAAPPAPEPTETAAPETPESNAAPEVADEPPAPPQQAAANTGAGLLPDGWAIQVGSFREEERATALVKRLLAADHKAYTRTAQANSQTYYRVYVGPKIARSAAEEEKAALDKLLKTETLIVRFEP